MRKRSGALHSESEEEFLLLAELSHEKTGYFYDEAVHSQLSKQLKQHYKKSNPKEQSEKHFSGFDFSTEDLEKQQQQQELQTKIKHKQINIVVVCSQPSSIKSILLQLNSTNTQNEIESPTSNPMDLFILKKIDQMGVSCFKIWIIGSQHANNTIYSTYLLKASRVFNFSPEQWSGGQEHPQGEAKMVLKELLQSLEY